MKIDIKQITEGEESISIRYRDPNPTVGRIIGILRGEGSRIWGRTEEGSVCIGTDDVLYLESVDDKVFAYTPDKVVRIDGTLNSFMIENDEDIFFRCSKSIVINVNRVTSLKSLASNRIDATMDGGEHIIISRRYASEFRRFLKGDR
ncbi:MAG: LytTR family transcriptional regulator DNA-binding domain-containing protein [Lachnospiraceae bacterium]|nr:LytTR family transcriptional regulator DNA-binding domain-containing protein [Lachnospiraceae bacterium]